MNKLSTTLQAGATLLLLSPISYGAFITNSNLAISGIDAVAVNQQYIDFDYTGGGTVTNPPIATGPLDGTGAGPFGVTGSSNGSFGPAFLPVNSQVQVHDLCRAGAGVCATPVTPGVSTTFNNFITFSAQPTWSVGLTLLQLGSGGLAGCAGAPGSGLAGQTCSIPNSPFTLTNQGNPGGAATGVIVSFSFLGSITDGVSTNPVTGNFSTTFSNTDLQTILAAINNNQAITTSDSGTLTIQSAVPEPSSLMFAGIGGLLVGLAAIRRRARQ